MDEIKKIPVLRFSEFSGEWEVKKIKDISTVKSGSTPLRSNTSFFKNGHIWWVKTTDLNNSNIIETEERITELALEKTSIKTYPKGSVLVAMYGGFNQIGRTGILQIDATTNQAISVLNTNIKVVLPQYLLTWLNAKVNVWRRFAGSSRKDPNITGSDVKAFPVCYPEIQEQQKIANFLTQIDRKIEQLSKKKQLLERYKKAMMQKLFSQQLRFKDDEGNDYPDWEVKNLGQIGTWTGGGTPETIKPEFWGGSIQWFTPTELKSKYVKKSRRTITDLGLKQSSAKLLPIGAVILSTRATVGDVSIALCEFTTNQGFQSVVVDNENSIEFIYYCLIMNRKEIIRKASGSTFLEISKKELSKISITFPSLGEQTKIANHLTEIDKKINTIDTQLNHSKQFKKGLLQQMFV